MSATLLYHMHGIRGYTYLRQRIVPSGIEFYISGAIEGATGTTLIVLITRLLNSTSTEKCIAVSPL